MRSSLKRNELFLVKCCQQCSDGAQARMLNTGMPNAELKCWTLECRIEGIR